MKVRGRATAAARRLQSIRRQAMNKGELRLVHPSDIKPGMLIQGSDGAFWPIDATAHRGPVAVLVKWREGRIMRHAIAMLRRGDYDDLHEMLMELAVEFEKSSDEARRMLQ
jgi:hypothetical protein